MKQLIKRMLQASFGLAVYGAGNYLMIQAAIGVSPWDVLALALAERLPVSYGVIVMTIGFIILGIDLLLGEPIGIGMVLDVLIVGNFTDLLFASALVPEQTSWLSGLLCMFVGLILVAFSQWIYMSAGLGCGPRDGLFVALGKRIPRIPIGAVQFGILAVVLLIGWLLGGPVGVGTLISVFGLGAALQAVFTLVHFEPRSVTHESILQSLRALRRAEEPDGKK